jgi:translation elongation factor EF-1beta
MSTPAHTQVARSSIIFDVGTWEPLTDLQVLDAEIRSIALEGLEWKASKEMTIAFNIKKLAILCHVEDDLVSVDELQELIEMIESVQSVDISSFSKL